MSDLHEDLLKRIERPIDGSADGCVTWKLCCPMCHGGAFVKGTGYFAHFVQDGPEAVQIGGKRLTTIHLICARCGFLSQHVPTVFTSDAVIADLPPPKDKWPEKTGSGWPDKYYPGM